MSTTEHDSRRLSYRDLLQAYERDPSLQGFAVLETGLEILVQELRRPGKFALGQLVMTPRH